MDMVIIYKHKILYSLNMSMERSMIKINVLISFVIPNGCHFKSKKKKKRSITINLEFQIRKVKLEVRIRKCI